MLTLSHEELENYSDWELENIAVSIRIILDKRALDRLKLEIKSKEDKEKIPYENTMYHYKQISENYQKNFQTRGSGSWFFRIMSKQAWKTYKEGFEDYVTEIYLEEEKELLRPFRDYDGRLI